MSNSYFRASMGTQKVATVSVYDIKIETIRVNFVYAITPLILLLLLYTYIIHNWELISFASYLLLWIRFQNSSDLEIIVKR